MAVDERLLTHWKCQRQARERARRALPQSWLADPRPEMQEAVVFYIEAMARDGAAVIPLRPANRPS
jgi:hypothetical protein